MPRRVGDLNEKQLRFAQEYLVDLNATQAAIRAGYSAKTAYVNGPRLLSNARIQALVSEGMRKRSAKVEVTAEKIVDRLAKIAFGDIPLVFGADGSLLRPDQFDANAAAIVSGVDVVTVERGEGIVEHVAKVRTRDTLGALTLLMRHMGMLKDSLDVNMTGDLGERLAKARERAAAARAKK